MQREENHEGRIELQRTGQEACCRLRTVLRGVLPLHRHDGRPGTADGAGKAFSAPGGGDALLRMPFGEERTILPDL
ncbi:hypothetical protein SDC9_192168 [bioreactor metagenome]|uniref:Uncharacterized protein n=1 Tax=bioreactor metagenome TaxID=1076179 RepID=A0A645IB11_9ZZZZ